MLFRKLVLRNFGAYFSKHEFHFDVKDHKSIVLIGGKNGAGKTTILEAIRIALYGPFAYGYKSESEGYQKKIYSILNRAALSNNESIYQVFLEFEFVEDLKRSVYTFKRQWYPSGIQVKEHFSIIKDGVLIDDLKETDIIQTKINRVFPPRLFELCLFDGETISRIITENMISDYLKESSYVLFNIELFINLNKDIDTIRKQLIGRHDPQIYKKYEQVIQDVERSCTRKLMLEKQVDKQSQEIKELQDEIENLKRYFSIYGGLVQEEREKILSEILALEQKRKEVSEQIKVFITGMLPLYIVREKLNRIADQMEREQQYDVFEYFSSRLTSHHMDELLRKSNLINEPGEHGKQLLKQLLEFIKPNGVRPIHRASFYQRSQVQSVINSLDQLNINQVLTSFARSNELLLQIQELRKKIEINDTNSEFHEITNQIQQLSKALFEASLKMSKLQSELEALNLQLTDKQKEQEQLEQKMLAAYKDQTTLKNIEKIGSVSSEFIRVQLEDKMEQVQSHALSMLRLLLRKENYIKRIVINPVTFDVALYSANDTVIDKAMLSAGEKQILLLSLIWSIVKVSGKKIPFVFDTLLGRLDQNHKGNVLTKFIPECGEQVIILSTDTEIDLPQINMIAPYISSAGTLINDSANTESAKYEKNKYFDYLTL
jgi:DNA sulfur modification protein DndD